jgi:hypothetical protein
VTEAIFGLIGVIIGGFLQGGWSWAMERRRDSWAARKAARLFAPPLHRCAFAINHAMEHGNTWGDLVPVVLGNLERWPGDAEVFAGTLDWEDWFDIYASVRALEQLTWNAPDDPNIIIERHDPYLDSVIEKTISGAVTCAAIGVSGTRWGGWRHWLRRMRRRLRPQSERDMLIEVLGDEEAADEILRDDDERHGTSGSE